jgi:hypothetical protein
MLPLMLTLLQSTLSLDARVVLVCCCPSLPRPWHGRFLLQLVLAAREERDCSVEPNLAVLIQHCSLEISGGDPGPNTSTSSNHQQYPKASPTEWGGTEGGRASCNLESTMPQTSPTTEGLFEFRTVILQRKVHDLQAINLSRELEVVGRKPSKLRPASSTGDHTLP